MGRLGTWLVGGALAALGLVAAIDALRGEERPRPTPASPPRVTTTTATEQPSFLGQVPRDSGFSGVLYYTGEDCRLRALRLPSLHEGDAPGWDGCRFSLSPTGRAVQPQGAAWDRAGIGWATEARYGVTVISGSGSEVTLRGSAPAYRPDGALTFALGESIRALREDCGRSSGSAIYLGAEAVRACSRVILSRADLRRAARRDSVVPENAALLRRVRVREAAWLSQSRLALVIAVDIVSVGHEELLAFFEGRRFVNVRAAIGDGLHDLRVSPSGSFIALRAQTRPGFLLLDRDGASVLAPPVTGYRAMAWAPDESWAALATAASIYVFRTRTSELRLRRLPIEAHDLAWRGTGGAPELGDTMSTP